MNTIKQIEEELHCCTCGEESHFAEVDPVALKYKIGNSQKFHWCTGCFEDAKASIDYEE